MNVPLENILVVDDSAAFGPCPEYLSIFNCALTAGMLKLQAFLVETGNNALG